MIARPNPDEPREAALRILRELEPDRTSRPAAPLFQLDEGERCREIERRMREAVEALEYFDSLPPEGARWIVRELLDYFGTTLGRMLADSADYVRAISETDRELRARAIEAFPNAAHRIRLAAALRDLIRTR